MIISRRPVNGGIIFCPGSNAGAHRFIQLSDRQTRVKSALKSRGFTRLEITGVNGMG